MARRLSDRLADAAVLALAATAVVLVVRDVRAGPHFAMRPLEVLPWDEVVRRGWAPGRRPGGRSLSYVPHFVVLPDGTVRQYAPLSWDGISVNASGPPPPPPAAGAARVASGRVAKRKAPRPAKGGDSGPVFGVLQWPEAERQRLQAQFDSAVRAQAMRSMPIRGRWQAW